MRNRNTENTRPFSIRLTAAERSRITEKAGRLPVGTYIRSMLLSDATPAQRVHRRYPEKAERILATILAALGESRIASNLNQLAKAAHSGSLPVNDETQSDLRQACRDVATIRQALLIALGVETDYGVPDASAEFNRVAEARP